MSSSTRKRRSSNFGTVRRLPSGRFQAIYHHDGQRFIGPHPFDTKEEADAYLVTVRADLVRGAWTDPSAGRVTFRQYAQEWMGQRHDLSPKTRELYGWLLDRHLVPEFSDRRLSAISPSSVRAWNAKLAAKRASTAAKAYRLLAQILRAAVDDRKLAASPCKVKGAGQEHAAERPVATLAEVEALTAAVPEDQRIAVLLAAWCQLRRGEVLGLRRRDVNLLHGTITVRQTHVVMGNGVTVEKTPKTAAGHRTLAIPSNVLPSLRRHLDEFVPSDPEALILDGGYRPLRIAWNTARVTTGLGRFRFHDLRHFGLTMAAATGASTAELMRRAGHASPRAALIYQHATTDRDQVLADALAELAMPKVVSKTEVAEEA